MRPSVWNTWFPLVAFAALGVQAKVFYEGSSVLYREKAEVVDDSNATFSLFERGTNVIDPRFLNGCAKVCGGQQCCGSHTSTKLKPRSLISKRAFANDISGYTQAQLATYMVERAVTDANAAPQDFEFVLDSSSDMPLDESIYMTLLNPGPGDGDLDIPMPTSVFKTLGNQAYNLVMRSLIGCTLLTVVKPWDPNGPADQTVGVWMGHMWEMPSFVPETEANGDSANEGSTHSGEESGEPIVQIARTFDTWVLQFLDLGFPGPNLPQLGTKPATAPAPTQQDGITAHLDVLKGAYYYLMHPNLEVPPTDSSTTIGYANTPQYPDDLASIKSKITTIDPTARIDNEFLYKAERDYEAQETIDQVPSGKALFEYVPNRNGRRYGRLLMEDGGVPVADSNGKMVKPGLKEFDFGPSSS